MGCQESQPSTHNLNAQLIFGIENGATSLFKLTSCTIVKNRQDACSTRDEFYCGTGILPVPKQVIENGATSEFKSMWLAR
ncbi:hypothetical protein D0A37_13915 [Microcoleus vaginatus HSN003]|nr:hypothetical protein D0A37_13915 [Microcoleus vaginatus HSN003]